MSDSVKKYHEMIEDKEIILSDQGGKYTVKHGQEAKEYTPIPNYVARDNANYIWVLDFGDGEVYRHDISVLGNEENGWNPDTESCEAFLHGAGHKVSDCEWMVTTNKDIYEDK